MSEKFTAGPWELKRALRSTDGAYDYGIGAMIDGNRYCIAETFGRVAGALYPPAEANAHLVAAAPTMYEALVSIQEWLMFNGPVKDDGITHPAFIKANNATVAALAKARGETP